MPETTKPQVLAQPGVDGPLPPEHKPERTQTEPWHKKVRRMRRDPTIKLARLLVSAPILASEWSYQRRDEDTTDDMVELVQRNMDPLRLDLLDHTTRGWLDFGWAPFEKVYEYDPQAGEIRLKKLKPLLQELTEILVDKDTGKYAGLTNCGDDLEIEQTLTLYTGVRGTYWYGEAIMEAAEDPFDAWHTVNKSADRYDKRVAGSHWVVYYPVGKSDFRGETDVDNFEIANEILKSLEASGRIVVPRVVDEMLAQLGQTSKESSWHVELISDNGTGTTSFVERMSYLDKLKVRGLGLPERAVLEGEHGTKAEAGAHGDFAITAMEMRHVQACHLINPHCVDHLLEMHHGPDAVGAVYIQPTPIADTARAFLREIYDKILSTPDGFAYELPTLDTDAIKDALGLPITENEDADEFLEKETEEEPEDGPPNNPFETPENVAE